MKKRISVIIICFLLLFGLSAGVTADDTDNTKFKIVCDGEEVSNFIIPQDEKRVLTVRTNALDDSYIYQWQVFVPEEGIWVDVYQQTEKSFEVSRAVIGEIMDLGGTASVRCKVSSKDKTMYSEEVCATIAFDPMVEGADVKLYSATRERAFAGIPLAQAEQDVVTITINYLDSDEGTAIYSPFIAEVQSGSNYQNPKIISPTFLGYKPYWNSGNWAIGKPALESDVPDEAPYITLNLTNVTENVVINIYYMPIDVTYSIRYFFQNVNNDLYIEDTSKYVIGSAKTGTIMGDTEIALPVGDTVGFTKLYHYPESVAADGSTAFECYYDRNYYLLKFDMDGGFGVDPVYGRYDAAFIVNDPEKPGFVFKGWDLVEETINNVTYDKNNPGDLGKSYGDGIVDGLPAAIPNASQKYKAVWETVYTTYTVVYWTQNADNNQYSYVGSEVRHALSNSLAQGACPIEEHTHSDDCLTCGIATHDHVGTCYGCGKKEHAHVPECYPDDKIIACGVHQHGVSCYGCGGEGHKHTVACYSDHPVNNSGTPGSIRQLTDSFTNIVSNPKNGYVYKTNYWGGKFDYYFRLSDKWYHLDDDIEGAADPLEGIQVGEFGDNTNVNGGRYYSVAEAIPDLSLCQCHTASCLNCELPQHQHTDACYFDLRHYEYKESILTENGEPIIVMGDGSTVVNVRYTRKEYTFRFYVSRKYKSGSDWIYEVSSNTTNYANENGLNLRTMLEAANWGKVDAAPTLNGLGRAARYTIQETEEPIGNYYYQYMDMTARYGQSIKTIFPVSMFNEITLKNANTYGDKVYFSAWNVEYRTFYNHHNGNKTLKGRYFNLDYTMLYNYCYTCKEDNCTEGSHTATAYQYEDSQTINFLAFWENAGNVGWTNIPHRFNYNVYLPVLGTPTGDSKVRDGVNYWLADTCVIYDNNGQGVDDSWLGHHTAPAIAGYSLLAKEGNWIQTWNSQYGLQEYDVNFYYERNKYSITFKNLDKTDKTVNNILYEAPLKNEFYTPNQPENLEDNAYYFDAWYTSEKCVDGTQFDFNTEKMPASNLILYAHWVPNVHEVRFFQTYQDLQDYEKDPTDTEGLIGEPHLVDHGNNVGTIANPVDKTEHDYTFSGWFYMENGVKTAFTPLDTPIKKDINVFADWGSHVAQPYAIHYALKSPESNSEITDLLDEKAGNAPADNTRYDITYDGEKLGYVYLEEDGKWHRCIADDTTGFAYQGSTRTFVAKAGDPYNQLYDIGENGFYNKRHFPLTATHSITMDWEEDKSQLQHNVYTFLYVQTTGNLAYKVRYVDKGTGVTLHVETKYTDSAVVTERFRVISNYVPDAFYKRLVLSVVPDPDSDGYISSPDNEIIFYYTKNDKVSFYAVHYMLQKPGTDGDNYALDGSGDYEVSDLSAEGVGDIGTKQVVSPLQFIGFDIQAKATTVIDGNNKTANVEYQDGKPYFQIEVTASGTELYVFYTRKDYNYKIYHLKHGLVLNDETKLEDLTEEHEMVLKIESTDGHGNPLTAQYGTDVTVTREARPSEAVFSGMICRSNLTQTITMKGNNDQNYFIFYYAPLQYTADYFIAGDVGGTITKTIEVVDENNFVGTSVIADEGYIFDKWYLDEECTIPVEGSGKAEMSSSVVDGKTVHYLKPIKGQIEPMPTINTFYAKFNPLYGDLTITRNSATDEGIGDQVFVYKVTNTVDPSQVIYVSIETSGGNGSVTIKNLLQVEYVVEQMNSWSWRYKDTVLTGELDDDVVKSVTITASGAEVVFDEAVSASNWLNANSTVEDNVKGGTP